MPVDNPLHYSVEKMMTQAQLARQFASMHIAGQPVQLYNIWDTGGAQSLAAAGAAAIATGSASVAAAHGYEDGEAIPLESLLWLARRIVTAVAVPVTVDFEGGYAATPEALAHNTARLSACGIAGLNFEDQIIGRHSLYPLAEQCERLAAVRQAAMAQGERLFINARTDLFLMQPDQSQHEALLEAAVTRARGYQQAGADGFFVPGLSDPGLISRLCAAVDLPVNVMLTEDSADRDALAAAGVARLSCGPMPYVLMQRQLMADYHQRFGKST
ncbi:MAG: isocitrate lyase/phosphoenolpyruvate mutase family protein [Wenzhouxiangellaceae bacterium]